MRLTMGSRGHGTYAKVYADVWLHEKTIRFAEALGALKVPRRWARREVVGQLHELLCWCLSNGDDGEVGHLSAEMFARVVGWDEPRTAARLLDLWRASGFLDVDAEDSRTGLRVHDFRECASDIIVKRQQRREEKAKRLNGRHMKDGRQKDGRRTDAARTPDGRRADALARAFGSGSDNDRPPTPTLTAAPDAPPGTATEPPAPDAAEECGPDSDAALLAAWNAGRGLRRLPAHRLSGDHQQAFVALRDATGGDADLALAVVAEFFRQDDEWIRGAAWSVKVFPTRLDAALVEARRRKPARPSGDPPLVLPRVMGATAAELRPYARRADQPFTREEEERIGAEIRAARGEPSAATPRTSWRPPVAVEGGPPDVREDAAP